MPGATKGLPSDRTAGPGVPQLWVDAGHRLAGAAQLPSPNHDERPDPDDISLLVIHAISLPPDQFGGPWISDLFLNRLDPQVHPYFATIHSRKVSAHLCIFRDGAITQYVPFERRAWHAGESLYEGRSRCNDFSIGIELEGCDTQTFTDAQYAALTAATVAILRRYPRTSPARITGHSDIAPVRKTDPGPHFDWARYRAGLTL
ncbi:MAG: 1,6-anhydro-N-acetylmuramyl-L-alanine amidase AmpD [Nevskia sp.]|nr:1,6-anhydro-N-acetylmuramyl-L-alanine amidase AmpD [Nevskia sp.]